ncbi:alkaline phosphatase family protein [Weissella soli]|uniref:Putative AlkP superfamily pyrophosphatase or phosphodiesterase n=1 Tax=Weissella soli TaxID=155866 RepID=A0A288Q634_9LACO|nr:ectonucleotide pyrophosphatase/phosphodiesterase [Weissella soli]AOT56279.1 Phosphodiesterase I [Weissella soli]NKY82738.1 alkaline phosphatase family protein [Weissella soli]RDL11853.1 putative AlkP superfamily pyrophosphatase or phosphodiesterase [Weissella soli]GEN92919.1 alkaline phosphatase family protein [Weissella soli]
MAKHAIVISLDSLGFADLRDRLQFLPNLAALVKQGTWVKEVKGVYPSITYPSHTSIITGTYPKTHGIVNATLMQPERISPDWYWYAKDIKVPTVYDLAQAAGLKTAAFLWPVTAGAKINWNIAEIFPNRIWTNQVTTSLKASSPLFLLGMDRKFGHLRQGIEQPALDNFITAAAVDTIIRKKPNLTLIHLVDMDNHRHRYGVRSQQAIDALDRLDKHVGELVAAAKEAGIYADTNFMILGDHYQLNVDKMIHLNMIFADRGWLKSTRNGRVNRHWRVIAKHADGAAYIYVRDSSLVDEVRQAIKPVKGVKTVFEHAEIAEFGADTNATFMVEAADRYFFTDETDRPNVVENVTNAMLEAGEPDRYKGTHGYHPWHNDYTTTAIFAGPDIIVDQVLDLDVDLTDEGPTMAKLLDLEFDTPVDGHVMAAIFKD